MTRADRSWAEIGNWQAFEHLVRTLVFFEDRSAYLPSSSGKDAGIDAISGDHRTVYQAKFHEHGPGSLVVADAFRELAKIRKYREVGHANHGLWKEVRNWVLVTNLRTGSAEGIRWSEVEAGFEELGIRCELWNRAKLDGLLAKHPEVDRTFFNHRPPALLTLNQLKLAITEHEAFLAEALDLPLVGRGEELAAGADFLAGSASFLLVVGPGGVGKTKFLLEFGESVSEEWDVYWGNPETMTLYGDWAHATVPGRPTLLLLDEPRSPELLSTMAEHIAQRSGSLSAWKVAVGVRTSKDPVVRALSNSRMKKRVQRLPISPLDKQSSREMTELLIARTGLAESLSSEKKERLLSHFSSHFGGFPVWITLGIHLLKEDGNLLQLPSTAEGLAREYVAEQLQHLSPEQQDLAKQVLRWISLIQPGKMEQTRDLLLAQVQISEDSLDGLLALMTQRGLLHRWGVRERYLEVQPDVIRDDILRDWLVIDRSASTADLIPSSACQRLISRITDEVRTGEVGPYSMKILEAIARVQWHQRMAGAPVDLLAGFFEALNLETLSTGRRKELGDELSKIAMFAPSQVLRVVREQLATDCEQETREGLLGAVTLGRDDIVKAQSWLVYRTASGIDSESLRDEAVRLMVQLVVEEEGIKKRTGALANDGKRATELLRRLIAGGPHYAVSFDISLMEIVLQKIDVISSETPDLELRGLVELVEIATALTRFASWTDGQKFYTQQYSPRVGSKAWKLRKKVLSSIEQRLSEREGDDEGIRVRLWEMLAAAKHELGRLPSEDRTEFQSELASEIREILEFAYSQITSRDMSVRELRAARELWSWHVEFDSDLENKKLAVRIEAEAFQNPQVELYEPLLGRVDRKQQQAAVERVVSELASAERPDRIRDFVTSAEAYAGGEPSGLGEVAYDLGGYVQKNPSLLGFISSAVSSMGTPSTVGFAVVMIRGWVSSLRQTQANAVPGEIQNVLGLASPPVQAQILSALYARSAVPDYQAMSDEELELIWGSFDVFRKARRIPEYLDTIGWTHVASWEKMRVHAETAIGQLARSEVLSGVTALAESCYRGVTHAKNKNPDIPPPEILSWLVSLLMRVPDIHSAISRVSWCLDELQRKAEPLALGEFVAALEWREEQAHAAEDQFRGLSYEPRVSRYVQSVDSPDSTELKLSLRRFLEFIHHDTDVGYAAPDLLSDIDPKGLLAPALIAERAVDLEGQSLRRLARFAKAYGINSDPWRIIAVACIRSAGSSGPSSAVFFPLTDQGPVAISAPVGEVPHHYVRAVELAKRRLDDEPEAVLVELWEWMLSSAEAELIHEQERVKEEGKLEGWNG